MKMPRFSLVLNLPPYQVTQLKAFKRSTSFHGSPEPMMVTLSSSRGAMVTDPLPITVTEAVRASNFPSRA